MFAPDTTPKQSKSKALSSKFMYVVALVFPLTTIPQIVTIFRNHSSVNVSLASWSLYAICALITLVYAITHNLKPLIIEGILWTIMYAAIITGIILYR